MSAELVPVRYLTAKEVADRYGLTLQWVYNCKTLPRQKVGKYLVFYEDELLEFEEAGRSGWREPAAKIHPESQAPSAPLLGRRYNRQKKQGARTDLTSTQIDEKSTAEKLGASHGVSRATVERAGKIAAEIEKVPELLSVAEICALENVNYKKVYRWVRDGKLRADLRPLALGGRLGLWFEKEDYDRFREERHRTRAVQSA